MINAIGLANPGIDNFGEEMKIARESMKPVIVMHSIGQIWMFILYK